MTDDGIASPELEQQAQAAGWRAECGRYLARGRLVAAVYCWLWARRPAWRAPAPAQWAPR